METCKGVHKGLAFGYGKRDDTTQRSKGHIARGLKNDMKEPTEWGR